MLSLTFEVVREQHLEKNIDLRSFLIIHGDGDDGCHSQIDLKAQNFLL
jgi:hypothetical protein